LGTVSAAGVMVSIEIGMKPQPLYVTTMEEISWAMQKAMTEVTQGLSPKNPCERVMKIRA